MTAGAEFHRPWSTLLRTQATTGPRTPAFPPVAGVGRYRIRDPPRRCCRSGPFRRVGPESRTPPSPLHPPQDAGIHIGGIRRSAPRHRVARWGVRDVCTRGELLAAGWTVRRIAKAVGAGDLLRVRGGLYVTPDVDRATSIAVRAGGRLGCVSELRRRGIWVRDDDTVHVHLARSAACPTADGVRIHWRRLFAMPPTDAGRVGILDALLVATTCLPRLEAIAALDSALNSRLVGWSELRATIGATRHGRRLLDLVDPRAQSGIESIVRVALRDLGLRVRSQVRYVGIGIVDLLVEDHIVVELDGAAFHDGGPVSSRDRRRDALHAAAGRTPLRFRYSQVMFDLPQVCAAIVGAVATHRRVRNPGRIVSTARRRARAGGPS